MQIFFTPAQKIRYKIFHVFFIKKLHEKYYFVLFVQFLQIFYSTTFHKYVEKENKRLSIRNFGQIFSNKQPHHFSDAPMHPHAVHNTSDTPFRSHHSA